MIHAARIQYELFDLPRWLAVWDIKYYDTFWFRIRLSDSNDSESINRLLPAKSFKEGFKDGSMRWKSAASLVVGASVEVTWVTSLIIRFSKSSNLLFVS